MIVDGINIDFHILRRKKETKCHCFQLSATKMYVN